MKTGTKAQGQDAGQKSYVMNHGHASARKHRAETKAVETRVRQAGKKG
jgi:hypothetical protein